MNADSIAKCKREVLRVQAAIKDVERASFEDPTFWITGRKETGALRRASMDLTRALAEMRRP